MQRLEINRDDVAIRKIILNLTFIGIISFLIKTIYFVIFLSKKNLDNAKVRY
jgi:hypothetical protein